MSVRFTAWIDAYEMAWRTAGTDALARLFTEEATYRPGPFELTVVGLEAIAEFWEAERDGPEEVFTLSSELVAVQRDTGVARVEVVYAGSRTRTYRDLWVITLVSDGRCRAFEEWPFYPEQTLTPPEDTLYDGEFVDFDLYDIREALTDVLGEHCGGVWLSGRGETRRLSVAITTRAPAPTRAAAEAIAIKAGLKEQVAFEQVVWSLAELQAGRERFETAARFTSGSPAEVRCTSVDVTRNRLAVAVAPELSEPGLRILGQAIAAALVPVQISVQHGHWVAAAG